METVYLLEQHDRDGVHILKNAFNTLEAAEHALFQNGFKKDTPAFHMISDSYVAPYVSAEYSNGEMIYKIRVLKVNH